MCGAVQERERAERAPLLDPRVLIHEALATPIHAHTRAVGAAVEVLVHGDIADDVHLHGVGVAALQRVQGQAPTSAIILQSREARHLLNVDVRSALIRALSLSLITPYKGPLASALALYSKPTSSHVKTKPHDAA